MRLHRNIILVQSLSREARNIMAETPREVLPTSAILRWIEALIGVIFAFVGNQVALRPRRHVRSSAACAISIATGTPRRSELLIADTSAALSMILLGSGVVQRFTDNRHGGRGRQLPSTSTTTTIFPSRHPSVRRQSE